MTLKELFYNKYLKEMKEMKPRLWEQIKYNSAVTKMHPAEYIYYHMLYITSNDFEKYKELFNEFQEWKNKGWLKSYNTCYNTRRHSLTLKGIKALKLKEGR